MKVIESTKNEKVKEIKRLQIDKRFFWWEGERFFEELIKDKIQSEIMVVTEKFLNKHKIYFDSKIFKDILVVKETVFNHISHTESPQGIGGLVTVPHFSLKELVNKDSPIFYLAGIQDPGNVGTIVRVSDAFNFSGIIYEKRGASPYSEKAVRSSAGSILRVKCVIGDATTLTSLARQGYAIFFMTPDKNSAEDISKIAKEELKKGVFVLGNEGSGIDFKLSVARNIFIPMTGRTESLNVAASATIVGFLCR